MAGAQKITFIGSKGEPLAARLDLPAGLIRATALFAHCFTCSKDIMAAKRIASELAAKGIAVLRFDFTGLGASGGDFANTNFSSNVEDLVLAAGFLRENYEAPSILVGHSLGGAAVLCASLQIPEVKAIATIGAPADAEHVVHNFGASLEEIERDGEATVSLAGRPFKIQKQFVDDLRTQSIEKHIGQMKKALMVLHSPIDATVGIENAARIFTAAKHPKSFVSLDNADHLLTRSEDAIYAAEIIAAWASRFIAPDVPAIDMPDVEGVLVAETGEGKYQNYVRSGKHRFLADEPTEMGGLDSGPSPYDFLGAALGACTSMTLRMYINFKKLDIGAISVTVLHNKVHAQDCEDCTDEQKSKSGKIDRFERRIAIEGDIAPDMHDKLLKIADKCPVHKTMQGSSAIVTKIVSPEQQGQT
ncbi:MAG: osmotically inducible protein C [Hyphomicrobiales bacterium]|nr:MAG: osmotically inducible protein C [Hyphomicrobiales bacterium]